MNEDIRTFLSRFAVEELVGQNILVPSHRWRTLLMAISVTPLIELMKEHNISRLEYPQRTWWLDSQY